MYIYLPGSTTPILAPKIVGYKSRFSWKKFDNVRDETEVKRAGRRLNTHFDPKEFDIFALFGGRAKKGVLTPPRVKEGPFIRPSSFGVPRVAFWPPLLRGPLEVPSGRVGG